MAAKLDLSIYHTKSGELSEVLTKTFHGASQSYASLLPPLLSQCFCCCCLTYLLD